MKIDLINNTITIPFIKTISDNGFVNLSIPLLDLETYAKDNENDILKSLREAIEIYNNIKEKFNDDK